MYELKTKVNDANVSQFIEAIADERKKEDSRIILDLLRSITGQEPKMWGEAIVGFGSYHYRGASGQEGDWMAAGFSPRKQSLTLYMIGGFDGYEEMLKKLGKAKTGKSCLYINRLSDLDMDVLKELVRRSYQWVGENLNVK